MKKGFLDPSLGSQDYVMEEGSCPEHQEEERGRITSPATCLLTAVAESLSTVTLPRLLVPAAHLPDHFLWCLLLQRPNGPSFLSICLSWLRALLSRGSSSSIFWFSCYPTPTGNTFTDI